MKAIVNTAPGRVEMQQWPVPEPAAGQVRVRTVACGICATDLEMIAGWQRTGFPAIPGHEWSGVVDAVGPGVERALVGKACVAENVVSDGGEVGFEHPGGYGQYFLTDARNIIVLPATFPLTAAALIEPLAVCVRAARRLCPEHLESAVIFGDGTIGLLMVMLLKSRGMKRVVLVGGRGGRLAAARAMGAQQTINYHEANGELGAAVLAAGGAFPNVIEASGSAKAMAAALDVAGLGGKILVIGDYGSGRADFPWNRVLHKELEIIGTNASAGAWPEAVRLATSGEVPLGQLVSKVLPVSSYAEALDLARSSRDVIKVVLSWDDEQ